MVIPGFKLGAGRSQTMSGISGLSLASSSQSLSKQAHKKPPFYFDDKAFGTT